MGLAILAMDSAGSLYFNDWVIAIGRASGNDEVYLIQTRETIQARECDCRGNTGDLAHRQGWKLAGLRRQGRDQRRGRQAESHCVGDDGLPGCGGRED